MTTHNESIHAKGQQQEQQHRGIRMSPTAVDMDAFDMDPFDTNPFDMNPFDKNPFDMDTEAADAKGSGAEEARHSFGEEGAIQWMQNRFGETFGALNLLEMMILRRTALPGSLPAANRPQRGDAQHLARLHREEQHGA